MYTPAKNTKFRALRACGLIALSVPVILSADETKKADEAAKEPIAVLETFVVKDVPNELSILPTSKPIASLYGDGRSIMETPRSVSAITKEMMELRNIERVEQLGLLSPGVYSPTIYGVAGVPTIRGDQGEVFQNGQRRRFQRLSYSPNFSLVESMDILKGAGTAVYGPVTRSGGLINLQTRKPLFGKNETIVKLGLGDLVLGDGDSYKNLTLSIDTNQQAGDTLAYRVVLGGREADSWYRNVFDDNRLAYAAFSYRPTRKLTNDTYLTYEEYDNNESLGSNRTTQEFIDNGTYVAGPATPLQTGTGNRAVVDAATAHKVTLPGWKTVTPNGSGGHAMRQNAQNITTYTVSPDLKLTLYAMYEYLEARKFASHSYQNLLPSSDVFDTRLETSYTYELGKVKASTVAGLSYRYDRGTSYQDGTDQVFALYDLNSETANYVVPGYPSYSVLAGTNGYIPGYDRATYRSVIAQTGRSTIQQLAPFIQQEFKFGPMLSLLGGLRYDFTEVEAERPLLLNEAGDPIAITGPATRATADVTSPTYNVSLVVTPKSWMSLYYTYNYAESVQGDNQNVVTTIDGNPSLPGFQPIINAQDLRVKNVMYEIGAKFSLLKNTVFISTAAFRQNRTRVDPFTFLRSPYNIQGWEGEISYQPNVQLSLYANATYTWGRQPDFIPNPGTKNYLDQFAPGIIVDGQQGTGLGSPNRNYNPFPRKTWHVPGLPPYIVNIGSTYMFKSGFGLTANVQLIDEMSFNFEDTLKTHFTYETGVGVLYRAKRWNARVSVMNLFDQRIVTPVDNAGGGNQIAVVERPRRANASFTFIF